jgi:NitT/TauT family transport system ATP-binding protein
MAATPPSAMSHLVLDHVRLAYRHPGDDHGAGELLALDDVNLEVRPGELVTVVGPSGCGKTSLLFLVNGLLAPTAGQVRVDGQAIEGPSADRALVFQDAALLPWRTVQANVELGLELHGRPAPTRRAAARRHLRLVGLAGFERFFPHQLSGGMRQRVGLARALAVEPRILLMDEPFAALDAQTRQLMGAELLELWERERTTILFITHDLDEAIFLADRVVILTARPGRVLDVVPIELPRPRELAIRSTPAFGAYRQRLWEELEREVRRALAAADGARVDAGG